MSDEADIEKACRDARIHVSSATPEERRLLLTAGKQLIRIGELETERDQLRAELDDERANDLERDCLVNNLRAELALAKKCVEALREVQKEDWHNRLCNCSQCLTLAAYDQHKASNP